MQKVILMTKPAFSRGIVNNYRGGQELLGWIFQVGLLRFVHCLVIRFESDRKMIWTPCQNLISDVRHAACKTSLVLERNSITTISSRFVDSLLNLSESHGNHRVLLCQKYRHNLSWWPSDSWMFTRNMKPISPERKAKLISCLDIYGALSFLGIHPFSFKSVFEKLFYNAFVAGQEQPLLHLMSQLMWRSTKASVAGEVSFH